MKKNLFIAALFLAVPAYAYNVELSSGESINGSDIKGCKFSVKITKDSSGVVHTDASNKTNLLLKEEDMSDFDLIQFFDINKDGYCELMIGTGKGDVNENYALFVSRDNGNKFLRSQLPSVANPEISGDQLELKYRDGAATISEKIKYSAAKSDFYIYREEVSIDGRFNKVLYLNEQGKNVKAEILTEDGQPAFAAVTADKSNFGDLTENYEFKPRKSYLIKGDKVLITDYLENEGGGWFKVSYKGAKSEVVGWMPADNF